MAKLPGPIADLIEKLIRLPGIGRRGAERLVTHLLTAPEEQVESLADSLVKLRTQVNACQLCGHWCEGDLCTICADPARREARLCVVESSSDLFAFEQSGAFAGRYHVLGGRLSPLNGVTPEELNIERLMRRIRDEAIVEVIVATSPTVEGDATATYLARRIAPLGVEVARIGLGLPLGASLGYADAGTLRLALEGRRRLDG
jgi:recombination protein RecR